MDASGFSADMHPLPAACGRGRPQARTWVFRKSLLLVHLFLFVSFIGRIFVAGRQVPTCDSWGLLSEYSRCSDCHGVNPLIANEFHFVSRSQIISLILDSCLTHTCQKVPRAKRYKWPNIPTTSIGGKQLKGHVPQRAGHGERPA